VDNKTDRLAADHLPRCRRRSSLRMCYDWLHRLYSDKRPVKKAFVLDSVYSALVRADSGSNVVTLDPLDPVVN